ncbi:MAG: hypothetical protein AEth_00479 [Candidatus Argoarchaeum ethanivorans]|uniref:DUF1894 domain-containing protein n=1 Tax=Candidatus Argoarchaeum ethanivorans TaxID=2608793 RepID=A0A811TDC0_9EURY|nr:MAG: hypothetical protein AEth_00479 [Candidatus Argoarchaeum ethanivorans]CAD6492755.1 MAG: hypothetical protein FFODKBPE_00361 [Candidatus Argoarchaeum ethanivorans]
MAPCVEELDYEILLSRTTFAECSKLIQKRCREIYFVAPGYKIFNIYLIGIPPLPIGIEGDHILIAYIKPCHGAFTLRIPGGGEIERIRKELKK